MGYYNWSSASALAFTCGHDNLKSFSCILSKFVMRVTNDQFNNGEKKINGPFFAIFRILRQYWPCPSYRAQVFYVSLPNLWCMLQMTSSQTSLIMAEFFFKCPFYCDFLHFSSIFWPCGHDNMKSFSFILFKFVLHVINKQFSAKFDKFIKKIKMADFLRFFAF